MLMEEGMRISVVSEIFNPRLESNIFRGEFVEVVYGLVIDSDNIMSFVRKFVNFVRIVLKMIEICSLVVARRPNVGEQ